MKKIILLFALHIFTTSLLRGQNETKLPSALNDEQIKLHLKEARRNFNDSTYIYSAIPEKNDFDQVRTNSDLHFPYPVIFIHGLTGSADTWFEFYDYALNQNWWYGGQLKFNLNSDDNISYSNIYSNEIDVLDFNFNIQPADFYLINFNCGIDGQSYGSNYNSYTQSNQAAIAKQGLAVREAIEHVLNATGRNKVILFGHSMGGLAARQYIQNPNFWQQDGQHHVAKLITSATPHGGSNTSGTFILDAFLEVDERSDAVRDLRRSYFYSGVSGTYLYGGVEDSFLMNGNLFGFYNYDVNCNGEIGNQIIGLNQKNIYIDLDYSCIIGDWFFNPNILSSGDGIVRMEDAQIKNYYNIISETFEVYSDNLNILHSGIQGFNPANYLGLDEPDYYDLAYEINVNTSYHGFITEQAPDAGYLTDFDDFIFETNNAGFINVSVENIKSTPFGVAILDAQTLNVVFDQTYNSLSTTTPEIYLQSGNYYLELYALGTEDSWQYPYGFNVNWSPSTLTSTSNLTNKLKIEVAPNPILSTFQLNVEGLSSNSSILQIKNEIGQILKVETFQQKSISQEIDISNFSSGIYFITIMNDKEIVTKKIVKS